MRSASTSARIQTEDARRCIGRALDFLVGAVACPVGCGLRPVASDGGGAPEPNDFTWALDLFGDRLARRGSDEWPALVLSVAMKASISAIGCLAPDAGRTADLVLGEDGAPKLALLPEARELLAACRCRHRGITRPLAMSRAANRVVVRRIWSGGRPRRVRGAFTPSVHGDGRCDLCPFLIQHVDAEGSSPRELGVSP